MVPILVSLPWAAIVVYLLWQLSHKDERHLQQVSELCQRVQAPDVAVAQHVMATEQSPAGLPYVPLDDDAALTADLQEMIDGLT